MRERTGPDVLACPSKPGVKRVGPGRDDLGYPDGLQDGAALGGNEGGPRHRAEPNQ